VQQSQDGHTITDPSIFRSLTTFWENAFFDDMARLHVLPPDTITRVSEYVPEIVKFVAKIVENGFAYVTESTGDVWFDVAAFEGAKSKRGKGKEKEVNGDLTNQDDEDWEHVYAKLQPWSKGNRELLAEGEGESDRMILREVPLDTSAQILLRLLRIIDWNAGKTICF
jgi:cysteinyl-tRNA synthetase